MRSRGLPLWKQTRRGFSLLEMSLAVVVGSMVVMLAIALLNSIERGNAMMSLRTQQTVDMQTTRLVLNRTFSTILAAQAMQQTGRAPVVAQAVPEGTPPAAVEPPARQSAPRVLLTLDDR
jgi:prepilin-type N-terminal cleavage/methylation domain-containing protein